jgi:hypothetical protein
LVSLVIIYTFRSVFTSVGIAYDVDIKIPDSELRIDKDKLNAAYDTMINKEIVDLKVK